MAGNGLTAELGDFCANLRFEDIPALALPFVRLGFTDCFATLVAGRHSETVRMLAAALEPSAGPCRLLVDRGTARVGDAACINATAAHVLDFDDAAQKGHISTVLVPAILAQAQACGANGRAMATAYAAGYEAWAELFWREPDFHHNFSWHPTGVFGPVAAAAACASLQGLHGAQATHAIAIAASMSSGLIASFGSMTKPLHAGRAAQAGVLAVQLARQGFTGAPDALENAKGLLLGISPQQRVDVVSPSQAGRHWKLPTAGLNIKKYPTCFASHRATDGALALIQDHGLSAQDVESVVVKISRRNQATLRFNLPINGFQAKFSMQFAMAASLIARRVSLIELEDDFMARPDLQDLMRRVTVLPEDQEDLTRPGEAPIDVVVFKLYDGRHLAREVDYVRGGPEHPLLAGELLSKFETCLVVGQLDARPSPLFNALMNIEALPDTQALYALTES